MSAEGYLIAEFARRARLPVSTLRYYDQIGLLPPAMVDACTGYRRYSGAQLADAVIIARLRDIGTSPDAIARIMAGGSSRSVTMATERRRLIGEIRERARALSVIDELDPPWLGATQDVQLVAVDVASLPFTSTAGCLAATVRRGIATLRSRLRRHHQLADTTWGALVPLDLEEQVTVHVFAEMRDGRPACGDGCAPVVTLPGGSAVRLVHTGPHDLLVHAYDKLLDAVERPRVLLQGSVIERYTVARGGIRTEVALLTRPPGGDTVRPAGPREARGTQRR